MIKSQQIQIALAQDSSSRIAWTTPSKDACGQRTTLEHILLDGLTKARIHRRAQKPLVLGANVTRILCTTQRMVVSSPRQLPAQVGSRRSEKLAQTLAAVGCRAATRGTTSLPLVIAPTGVQAG